MHGVTHRLEEARLGLEAVCDLLLQPSPEALEQCAERCQRASAELAASLPQIHTARGRPEVLAAARRLSEAIRSARRLLEHAATYHARWQAILGAMSGGYLPGGEPAPVVYAGRFTLRV